MNINAAAAAAIEAPDITEGFMSYSFLVLIGLGTGSVTRQNAVGRNTSQQEDVTPREHSHQWDRYRLRLTQDDLSGVILMKPVARYIFRD